MVQVAPLLKNMKRQRNIIHAGPHTINNKWLGEFNERTEGIIVESITTREGQRQIKPMRTENINLLAGELTVAVWRIKKRVSYSLTNKSEQMDLTFDPKEGSQDEVANEGAVENAQEAEQSQTEDAG